MDDDWENASHPFFLAMRCTTTAGVDQEQIKAGSVERFKKMLAGNLPSEQSLGRRMDGDDDDGDDDDDDDGCDLCVCVYAWTGCTRSEEKEDQGEYVWFIQTP